MSMFAKYYHTKNVCYDSDYDENDFQAPDEDDEPDTLDENVPTKCLFTKPKNIAEKKPTKIAKCTCGWFCELPESHIEHSKWSGCDYINSKYDLSYDSDGEIHGTLKSSKEEKKPTKKQPKKDGKFDICGRYGEGLKECSCFYCTGYIKNVCITDNWHATKLTVNFKDKDHVKSKGALWSQTEKCWYVRASNPNYKELVDTY